MEWTGTKASQPASDGWKRTALELGRRVNQPASSGRKAKFMIKCSLVTGEWNYLNPGPAKVHLP